MSSFCANELQNKILDIFIEIEKIINRHHLRYFAIGGTCLGAVRHKGFIPWDDDFDIAMPDEDYNLFLKFAPSELPPSLEIIYPGTRCLFAKVQNINTTLIEKLEIIHPELYKGIYVDIMPFYGIPDAGIKRNLLINEIRFIRKLDYKKREPFNYNKRLSGKTLWLLSHPFNCLVSKDYYYRVWEKLVSRYKFDNSNYTGFTWSNLREGLIFKKDWFDSFIELPFENITVRCPKNWDKYLSSQFGDYMSLPPKKEQKNKHIFIVDINSSYKMYQAMSIEEIKKMGGWTK